MKIIFTPLFAGLLGAVVLITGSCSNNNDATDQAAVTENTNTTATAPVTQNTGSNRQGNDLPRLPLTSLDGSRFMANSLEGKTVLVLFQPECEDCQREAAQIQQNLPAFDEYSVYFISNADLQEQARFAEKYGLTGHKNVHFAQTSINDIINTLGPSPAPSVFIYSAEGRLVKEFKGETEIQQILGRL